jgi:hypothetical protein
MGNAKVCHLVAVLLFGLGALGSAPASAQSNLGPPLVLGPNSSATFGGQSFQTFSDIETAPGATLTIFDNGYVQAGSVHNSGAINLQGGTLNVSGSDAFSGNPISNDSTTGSFQFSGGRILGASSFSGVPLVQTGGVLQVLGAMSSTPYTLGPGTLQVRLYATAPGSTIVTGDLLSAPQITLNVGATLNVVFLQDFQFTPGQTFNLLDFSSIQGQFSTLNLPALTPGQQAWDTSRLYVDGTISVVALPHQAPASGRWALAALASSLILVAWNQRLRKRVG